MAEAWELTKEAMSHINDTMPPEAEYGDVFDAIAHAAQLKLLEWGEEECMNLMHRAIYMPALVSKPRRFDCPECMAELRAKLEAKHESAN